METTTDLERQSRYDATKVSISMAVKAIIAIIASILVEGLEWKVNAVALLGLAYFFELVALALIPDDVWKRIGHRLVPPRNDPPPPSIPPSEPPISFPPIGTILLFVCVVASNACAGTIVRDGNTYKQEIRVLAALSTKLADVQLVQAVEAAKSGDFARCNVLAEVALVAQQRAPWHAAKALYNAGIGPKPGDMPVVPIAIEWCEQKGMTQ